MGKLHLLAGVDKGYDGILCEKTKEAEFKRLFYDGWCHVWYRSLVWCYTKEAHKCSCDSGERVVEIQPHRNTDKHNTHGGLWLGVHVHTACCMKLYTTGNLLASMWLWLSGVLFHISMSSHTAGVLSWVCVCVCERDGMLAWAAVTNHRPASTPTPRKISPRSCWGPHHSQLCIHWKFIFSDTLSRFVSWHDVLSQLANWVLNWKRKQTMSFRQAKEYIII